MWSKVTPITEEDTRPNGFSLQSASKTLEFYAKTPHERVEWMTAIKSQIQQFELEIHKSVFWIPFKPHEIEYENMERKLVGLPALDNDDSGLSDLKIEDMDAHADVR